jgi:hypothetical protein
MWWLESSTEELWAGDSDAGVDCSVSSVCIAVTTGSVAIVHP